MSDRPIIIKNDGCSSCLWTAFKIFLILAAINLCILLYAGASG